MEYILCVFSPYGWLSFSTVQKQFLIPAMTWCPWNKVTANNHKCTLDFQSWPRTACKSQPSIVLAMSPGMTRHRILHQINTCAFADSPMKAYDPGPSVPCVHSRFLQELNWRKVGKDGHILSQSRKMELRFYEANMCISP